MTKKDVIEVQKALDIVTSSSLQIEDKASIIAVICALSGRGYKFLEEPKTRWIEKAGKESAKIAMNYFNEPLDGDAVQAVAEIFLVELNKLNGNK